MITVRHKSHTIAFLAKTFALCFLVSLLSACGDGNSSKDEVAPEVPETTLEFPPTPSMQPADTISSEEP